MPRPERILLKERELAGLPAVDGDVENPAPAKTPIKSGKPPLTRKDLVATRRRAEAPPEREIGEPEIIDTELESGDNVRTGPVVNDDPEYRLAAQVAKRMGWTPKEEWDRDPTNWIDAPEFLETVPARITSLTERQKRWGQVAEAEAERARLDALEQAKANHAAAVKTGDVEAATKAAQQMANPGPPPQTVAWLGKNPWFHTDPDAKSMAVRAIEAAAKGGAGIEDQLKAGESAVRRRFPEYFDDAPIVRAEVREAPREARLSEIRPAPPAVAPGSRTGTARAQPKEKGWMDISSNDRAQMRQFVTKAMRKGMTEAEATSRLARDYWNNKDS